MDGIYISTIKTSAGIKQGKLILKTNNNVLSGSIEAMGMKSNFTNGTINGNTCKFSGTFRFLLGYIKYEATGVIEKDEIKLLAKTNRGNFEFLGKKQ